MIYIHKNTGFWELTDILPSSYKVGTTLEEYEEGAYLALSDEQAAFHAEHPDASQMEVWNMELTPEPEQPNWRLPGKRSWPRSKRKTSSRKSFTYL